MTLVCLFFTFSWIISLQISPFSEAPPMMKKY